MEQWNIIYDTVCTRNSKIGIFLVTGKVSTTFKQGLISTTGHGLEVSIAASHTSASGSNLAGNKKFFFLSKETKNL